jgi:hypothetical protein
MSSTPTAPQSVARRTLGPRPDDRAEGSGGLRGDRASLVGPTLGGGIRGRRDGRHLTSSVGVSCRRPSQGKRAMIPTHFSQHARFSPMIRVGEVPGSNLGAPISRKPC